MNALPLMAEAAALFRSRLLAEPGCARLPLPSTDLPSTDPPAAEMRWDNLLLGAPRFRRAHVETLEVPGQLSVLHVCVFPHLDDPSPIFGFDMIAGPARVTGIFLDLSPVTGRPPVPGLRDVADPAMLTSFAARRVLPEWGDIFSPDLLAVRPADIAEISRAIGLARQALEGVLAALRRSGPAREPAREPIEDLAGDGGEEIAAGQARYVAGQRRNQHTLRMLAGFIGPVAARRFIDEVLFPPVPEVVAMPRVAWPIVAPSRALPAIPCRRAVHPLAIDLEQTA
jgi:phycocyanobilin:ferredoxin oxidoreductase